ncbi:MAG: cupin domain-containing protein [Spirochaetales bacterium]|nr:cupin domain-containing protein [Spirochaetales bacterium]
MKQFRLHSITDIHEGHFLKDRIPGKYISRGALMWGKPGQRTHTNDGPDGKDYHVHDDEEIFVVLQGKGIMELEGDEYPLFTGDVMIVEPGEDHHLVIDEQDPCVIVWFHASDTRPA